ncbi:MAG: hypothetical protein AAFY08_03215 [Planctomycetota bacterium]
MTTRCHLRGAAIAPDRVLLAAALGAFVLVLSCLTPAASAQPASNTPRFQSAADLIIRFEFDAAYDEFTQLREDLTTSDPRYRDACFGLAVAAQHRIPPQDEYIDQATELYNEIIELNATDELAARSMMNLGRILELRDYLGDPHRPDDAIAYYERVHQNFPDRDIAHEAAFRQAGALIQQFDDPDDVPEGVAFLESWLKTHPDNPYAGGMHVYLYDYYRERDLKEDALRHLIEGDRVGMPLPRVGEMYWQAAQLAEAVPGRLDVAIRFYTKTITDAVTSGRAYEAQLALARLKREHPDAGIEIPELVFGVAEPGARTAPTP